VGVIEDNSIILPNVINRNVGTTFQYFLAPLFSDSGSLQISTNPDKPSEHAQMGSALSTDGVFAACSLRRSTRLG